MQLKIPVPDFQDTDIFQVHCSCCTGKKSFRNSCSRNELIGIQAGALDMYGKLSGGVVAHLGRLLMIRNMRMEFVTGLPFVQVLDRVHGGRCHRAIRHIPVCKRRNGRNMWLMAIGVVVEQADVVPSRDGQWLVNQQIDLRTFNDIY